MTSTPFGRALVAELEQEFGRKVLGASVIATWTLERHIVILRADNQIKNCDALVQRVLTRMHEEAGDTPGGRRHAGQGEPRCQHLK